MSSWFGKSKKLLEGFSYIKSISDSEFQEILEKTEACRNGESELENIEIFIEKLSNPQKVLITKTVFYLLQRLNIFIIKPAKIQQDLKEVGIPESKIELLLRYYREQNKEIINSLETRHDGLTDINWKLKTVLSTETQQKVIPPMTVANIEMHFRDTDSLNLEMNHRDLYEFYEHLENIQQELDMRSKT